MYTRIMVNPILWSVDINFQILTLVLVRFWIIIMIFPAFSILDQQLMSFMISHLYSKEWIEINHIE